MKFKTILGAAVALGTIALASVTAHAATFSASNATTANTAGNYEINLSVKGDNATETLNGYIVKVTYDADKVALVQPNLESDDWSESGSFCKDGVFVSGVTTADSKQTGEATVAWAVGTAKTIGTSDVDLAKLTFEKKEGFTSGSTPISIELKQLSYTGATLDSATGANAGSITVGGTVVLYGDADGDGDVTSNDATIILKHELKPTLTGEALKASDVDGDGDVTSTDATYVLKYELDNSLVFPALKK